MSKAESIGIPFYFVGNRACLTGLQIVQHPELAAFVKRFKDCFRADPISDVYWYEPPDPLALSHFEIGQ